MMNRTDPMRAVSNSTDPLAPDERAREAVSALFDGEADELELRRLLASDRPEAVRGAWHDYQLQRDALQGLDMRFAGFDISARVQAALADEAVPAVAVGDGIGSARWWRPFASVAVAASVATVVVIGARSFNPGVDPTGGFAAQSGAVAQLQTPISANLGRVYAGINPSINNVALGSADFSGSEVTGKDASSNQWSGLVFPRNDTLRAMPGAQTVGYDADQLAQQRLQQYLLRHTERAAFNNGQGVISFSKVSQLNGE